MSRRSSVAENFSDQRLLAPRAIPMFAVHIAAEDSSGAVRPMPLPVAIAGAAEVPLDDRDAGKTEYFLSMPVSNTATTTPSPVTREVLALTAEMPHASAAAATPAGTSNGIINLIGMGRAIAATSGSRAALTAS
jgi:hypothetical protein